MAKGVAATGGWWLCLAEQVGISVHITCWEGGSWDDSTGIHRGILGVAGAPSLLEMHPHVSITPIPPYGEENTQMGVQFLLFLCVGSSKLDLLHLSCFRRSGVSGTAL